MNKAVKTKAKVLNKGLFIAIIIHSETGEQEIVDEVPQEILEGQASSISLKHQQVNPIYAFVICQDIYLKMEWRLRRIHKADT